MNGVIYSKIVEGSFTARRFYDFIDGLLDHMQPFPLPNSVIVMDNARIHKDPRVLDLILARHVPQLSSALAISDTPAEECGTCSFHHILPTTIQLN